MDLIVQFDQAISSLPSGFVSAVNYVVSYFDSLFTNNVTVTIDVGYGEIDGQALESDALGESEQADVTSVGYNTVRNALLAENASGASTLPSTSPAPSHDTLYMPSSEQKALGLIASNNNIDGYVGFDSAANTFSYAIGAAPPSNEYYFVGVVEHEFTEVMGRTSYLDYSHDYSLMDLFRYAATGERQFTTGAASYFSIDNGTTDLDNWNNFQTGNSGDLGDWAPSAGDDAFDDNSNPGVINSLSQADLTLMNALGWTIGSQSSPPPTDASATGLREVGTGNFGSSPSDVLWQSSSGTPTIWLMNGNSETATTLPTPPSAWQIDGILGFMGDPGQTGIAWHIYSNGDTILWLMNGATLSSTVALPTTPPGWNIRTTADPYDTGANNTIVWQNDGGYTVIWEMNGANIVTTGGLPTTAPTDQIVGAGDFYDRGFSDTLLLIDTTTNTPTLWQLSGGNVVSQATLPTPPVGSWHYRGIGNVFNDGHDDTIVWEDNNGDIDIWHMQGGTLALTAQVASVGADWTVVGVGDFNNNGYSDLLLENSGTGATEIMYLQGTQVVSTATITAGNSTSLMASEALPDTVVGFGDVSSHPSLGQPQPAGTSSTVTPTPYSGTAVYTPTPDTSPVSLLPNQVS